MLEILAQEANDGSVIVAVAIIALIAIITVIAMFKYDVDGVLKIWGALGTLSGLVAGTMATYFFTKGQVQDKNSQIKSVQSALTASEKEKVSAGKQIESLVETIKPEVSQGRQGTLAKLEEVSRTLKDTSTITLPANGVSPQTSPVASPPQTDMANPK